MVLVLEALQQTRLILTLITQHYYYQATAPTAHRTTPSLTPQATTSASPATATPLKALLVHFRWQVGRNTHHQQTAAAGTLMGAGII